MDKSIANRMKRKVMVVIAMIVIFSGAFEARAQETNIYRLQSLFIYNFTKHVKWENTEGSTFTIGIYGNLDAFNEIKANLGEKLVWGNKINVIQINSSTDISKCHIAYLSKSNKKKVIELLSTADFRNTLVVTEDDMVNDGAAISFVFQEQKMNFKISKDKIEQAGLKVSSSLISIGIPV